jgi:hypothetical protein
LIKSQGKGKKVYQGEWCHKAEGVFAFGEKNEALKI